MSLADWLTPQWRHRLFLAYVAVMVLIFLTPTPDLEMDWRYVDKAVHFALFFGFALVFFFDRRASPGRTFLVSCIFAAGVELVQWVLPFRDVELADFLAGAAGAALVTMILLFYRAFNPSGSASGT
jgi:VanZ family protein